ncbi:transcriptional regulator [Actinomyces oris]|jgi:transcriptional regulator, XRE family|uniref:helix-turn-helix domain-containing protein n=1 Tax=Actinomyces oris TaxID=544580 RepID=UPI00094DA730|nr:helix-turn-helix transcriptional regulator [Actinomyces oris]OLO67631.1 transcriptional regulator [Actinomyces oris]
MPMTIAEFLEVRPVDREQVDAHKKRMLAKIRAYRLRELRKQAGLTQAQLADRIGVRQRQISKIECGEFEDLKSSTIRRYLEAVGGNLPIDVTESQRPQAAQTSRQRQQLVQAVRSRRR